MFNELYKLTLKSYNVEINLNNDLQKLVSIESEFSLILKEITNLADNKISTEGFGEYLQVIIDKFKMLLEKFILFYKNITMRINVFLINICKDINKITDELRYIRNKTKVKLSKDTLIFLYKNYPTSDVTRIGLAIPAIFNNLKTIYLDIENSLIDGGFDDFESTDLYYTKGKVISLENIDGKLEIKETILENNKKVEELEIGYGEFLTLGKELDKIGYNIKEIFNNLNKVNDKVYNKIKEINSIKNDKIDVKYIRNLTLIYNKVFSILFKNIIDNYKVLRKFLKMVIKDASFSSSLGYELFIKLCKEDPDFFKRSPVHGVIASPNDMEVIEEKGKLYINLKKLVNPNIIDYYAFTSTSIIKNEYLKNVVNKMNWVRANSKLGIYGWLRVRSYYKEIE